MAAGHADLARIAGWVPPERRTEYETLRAALEDTDDCESLPTGLNHSDCHIDNAILTADRRPKFNDWVGSGQGPRVAALSLLLYSCAIRAPGDDPDSPWAAFWREHSTPASDARQPDSGRDPAQMRGAAAAVIEGYCRHYCLTPAERERLLDAIRFRPAVIAAREFAASLERGTPANASGWWTRFAEAEVVAAHARRAMEAVCTDPPRS